MSDSLQPQDSSQPGSSVHGILQARILEWAAISYSRASSWPKDLTWVSCIAGRFFTIWATRETEGQRWDLHNFYFSLPYTSGSHNTVPRQQPHHHLEQIRNAHSRSPTPDPMHQKFWVWGSAVCVLTSPFTHSSWRTQTQEWVSSRNCRLFALRKKKLGGGLPLVKKKKLTMCKS